MADLAQHAASQPELTSRNRLSRSLTKMRSSELANRLRMQMRSISSREESRPDNAGGDVATRRAAN